MTNTQQEANTVEKEKVIVYTRTVCPKCMLVKQMMDSAGVEYETINLDHDEEAEEMMREKGFMALPIAQYDGEFYVDVKPVQQLVNRLAE